MPHLFHRRAVAACLVLTFISFPVSPFNLSPWSRDVRFTKKIDIVSQVTFRSPSSYSRSGKGQRARDELTCGLQISVRIRGKKGREEDYTTQAHTVFAEEIAFGHGANSMLITGKTGSGRQAYDEYAKRLRPVLGLETHWHKTDEDLEAAVRKDAGVVVCLDERGRQMDSQTFSAFLFSKLEEGGSRVTFVVGGAEGLPPGLKSNPPQKSVLLSLSSMTFTHLWARALLAEQIYRASEIRRGSQYHKE